MNTFDKGDRVRVDGHSGIVIDGNRPTAGEPDMPDWVLVRMDGQRRNSLVAINLVEMIER
jgi:hypothetical protein